MATAEKNKKKPTERERQCKKISRQRANRQRFRIVARRVGLVFSVLFVAVAGVTGWSIWESGKLARWQQGTVDSFWQMTAGTGFTLRNVTLSGHEKVAPQTILAKAGLRYGAPILAYSLEEMRARLEEIPGIRHARIARILPGTLHIALEERRPFALWQQEGTWQLVDRDGVTLGTVMAAQAPQLPLLVGAMRARHIREFYGFLSNVPALQEQLKSASLIHERRWNVLLQNGMEIKLPEEGLETAWQRLDELIAQDMLLREDIEVIDLRIPDRMFIRQQKPEPTADAETQGAEST
jgi:cell division protein FtsQ